MKIFDKKGEYSIPPVDNILKKYTHIVGVSWDIFWKRFDLEQIELIFLLVARDFFENGKISLDQFSAIANELLYNDSWSPAEFGRSRSAAETMRILDSASELAYYNWRKNKESEKILKASIKEIKNFYNDRSRTLHTL